MVDDCSYPSEQILIHEFGHTGVHTCMHQLVRDEGCTLVRSSLGRGLHVGAVSVCSHGRGSASRAAGGHLCSTQSCNQAAAV